MRKKIVTTEEKVAIQLSNILSDLRLDLDMVGKYIVQISPTLIYNRLITVTESAEEAKDKQVGHNQMRLF